MVVLLVYQMVGCLDVVRVFLMVESMEFLKVVPMVLLAVISMVMKMAYQRAWMSAL
jgi:hypothetical protein